jgi:hypothetical protein
MSSARNVMVYRGQVHGDVIVLSGGVRLPQGTEVLVEPVQKGTFSPKPTGMTTRNGVPVFPKADTGTVGNLDLVNELRDDPS